MAANRQRGFSIVEVVVAIAVVSMLATAFLSAFSSLLKSSVSGGEISIMESLATSQLERALSGTFQSAVALSGTQSISSVDDAPYSVTFLGQSSVVNTSAVDSGLHVTVVVGTTLCASCVRLSGDTFDVQ